MTVLLIFLIHAKEPPRSVQRWGDRHHHHDHGAGVKKCLTGSNSLPSSPCCGIVLLMAAFAYLILQRAIIAGQGRDSLLAGAIGSDRKGKLSILCYFTAIGLAFVSQRLSDALYVFVAIMWLILDRRVERALAKHEG
jgi:hypothetical protein